MASERQIAANRGNAQRSTGPRSAFGKQQSSQNAVKHGLTAKHLVLSWEDLAEFDQLRGEVFGALDPGSAIELQFVDRVASLIWRLRRVPAFESALLEMAADDHEHLAERLHANG